MILLAHGAHSAELQHGLPARLRRGHARAQILFRLQGDMLLHLLAQALIVPSAEEIRHPGPETPEEFHGRSPALISKNRVTNAVVCSQFRVSASNCFRPAAVSR